MPCPRVPRAESENVPCYMVPSATAAKEGNDSLNSEFIYCRILYRVIDYKAQVSRGMTSIL